jgi:hypothetical protein
MNLQNAEESNKIGLPSQILLNNTIGTLLFSMGVYTVIDKYIQHGFLSIKIVIVM